MPLVYLDRTNGKALPSHKKAHILSVKRKCIPNHIPCLYRDT